MPPPLAPGQLNVTLAQYQTMMLATMEEVWSRYPGGITEVRRACEGACSRERGTELCRGHWLRYLYH